MREISNSTALCKAGEITASGFDYSVIDSDTAALAQAAANTIRTKHGNVVQNAIEAGRELLKVRERLDGHFLSWVKAEFQWSDRTAENYMLAAREFGSRIETVSNLPLRLVYALAAKATPAEVRNDIVQRLERGDRPAAADINEQIDEARERARMVRAEAKLSEAQRRRNAKRHRHQLEEKQRLRQERDREIKQAASIAKKLIEKHGRECFAEMFAACAEHWYLQDALRDLVNAAVTDDGPELPAALDRRVRP